MSDFLKDIIKETGNEYASLVSDGASGDVTDFIDTGSYIFNALLGGGIHRGLPSNKITAIAVHNSEEDEYYCLVLDEKKKLSLKSKDNEIIESFETEFDLLQRFFLLYSISFRLHSIRFNVF